MFESHGRIILDTFACPGYQISVILNMKLNVRDKAGVDGITVERYQPALVKQSVILIIRGWRIIRKTENNFQDSDGLQILTDLAHLLHRRVVDGL